MLRLAAALAGAIISSPALAAGVCEREITRHARVHGVPAALLYAVALNESGRRGALEPLAMNIDGAAYFAPDLAAALRRFEAAKRGGARFIDIGCMQINQHFHGAAFLSVEAMFDPARNVGHAARFLSDLRRRHGSWTMALARYHAGPTNTPAHRRYLCGAITHLVRAGLGGWTPAARALCQAAPEAGAGRSRNQD